MNYDAVAVSPEVYKVLFENDRVREFVVEAEPKSVIAAPSPRALTGHRSLLRSHGEFARR